MIKERRREIIEEISKLVDEASSILIAEHYRHNRKHPGENLKNDMKEELEEIEKQYPLRNSYQSWYSRSLPVISQLAPDRREEFELLYRVQKRKQIDPTTYGISDYLQGVTTTRGAQTEDYSSTFASKFQMQIYILESVSRRIDSVLADIRSVLQADLFDSELSAAEELWGKNHLRAAGALAGVTLEAHLEEVCQSHLITVRKKSPSISDYNDVLKKTGVIDTPLWRKIQGLADIRNLCTHKKQREPTKEEIEDLIEGVKRIIKMVF